MLERAQLKENQQTVGHIMGVILIDRRLEPAEDKFGTDRQRFLERVRDILRKAIHEDYAKRSIQDMDHGGLIVPLPPETIEEHIIHHGEGGTYRRVFPGLMNYEVGDRIPKPPSGKGKPQGPSKDGDTEDSSIFLTPEEQEKIFFEGRRLPDMTKFMAPDHQKIDQEHAGYTNKGPFQKLDMDRTNRKRAGDALILSKMGEKRVIDNLAEQFNIYASYKTSVIPLSLSGKNSLEKREAIKAAATSLKELFSVANDTDMADAEGVVPVLLNAIKMLKDRTEEDCMGEDDRHRLGILESRLGEQIKLQGSASRYRPEHLTYKYDDEVPQPAAKAVLFCKMDVSASMDQKRKNAAKSFFWLLNKFLKTKYEEVEIVFIAHTTQAKEVDEEEFFHGKDSGGTIVSTCLKKEKEIIEKRYPPSVYNIYSAQASDGENTEDDNPEVVKALKEVLPWMQAYYYIQVDKPGSWIKDPLLPIYKTIAKEFPGRLFTAEISNPGDAIEAFTHLFPSKGNISPQQSYAYNAAP